MPAFLRVAVMQRDVTHVATNHCSLPFLPIHPWPPPPDTEKQKIVATATLLVELKYIRECGKAGHIEDVVVDSSYRGMRLGQR